MKSFGDYLGLSNSCSYDVDDVIGRVDRFGFQNFCSPDIESCYKKIGLRGFATGIDLNCGLLSYQIQKLASLQILDLATLGIIRAPSSQFVSSSIPSWQILTAHAQTFRGARDQAFCLKVPLDSLLVWASREGSGETAQMRRLTWTFAARICDKNQICLTRSMLSSQQTTKTHETGFLVMWLILYSGCL